MLPWKPNSSPYLHPYRLAASLAPALSVAVFLSLLHLSASFICVWPHNMAKMCVFASNRVFMQRLRRMNARECIINNAKCVFDNTKESLSAFRTLSMIMFFHSQLFISKHFLSYPPPESFSVQSYLSHGCIPSLLFTLLFSVYSALWAQCTIILLIPLLNTYNTSPRTQCS